MQLHEKNLDLRRKPLVEPSMRLWTGTVAYRIKVQVYKPALRDSISSPSSILKIASKIEG